MEEDLTNDGYWTHYYFATRKIGSQEYDKMEVVKGHRAFDSLVKPVDIQYMFDISTGEKDPAKARALLEWPNDNNGNVLYYIVKLTPQGDSLVAGVNKIVN